MKHTIVQFYESERPVGIYCHGTSALVDLKLSDGSYLVAGKTVTGFANVEENYSDNYVGQKVMPWRIEDALRERGANYVQGESEMVNSRSHLTDGPKSPERQDCQRVHAYDNPTLFGERSKMPSVAIAYQRMFGYTEAVAEVVGGGADFVENTILRLIDVEHDKARAEGLRAPASPADGTRA